MHPFGVSDTVHTSTLGATAPPHTPSALSCISLLACAVYTFATHHNSPFIYNAEWCLQDRVILGISWVSKFALTHSWNIFQHKSDVCSFFTLFCAQDNPASFIPR